MYQRVCNACPEPDMQWSVFLSALVVPIVAMIGGVVFLFWAGRRSAIDTSGNMSAQHAAPVHAAFLSRYT